jgi:SAM-dependent methyltransferase
LIKSSSSSTTQLDAGGLPVSKPLVLRSGRAYLNDATLPYPLPVDLAELHRQSLRTLLLIQVFGGPVCSPSLAARPPQRVLEVGCGSGFWSMMCHRYFVKKGHANISFTGIDIGPMATPSAAAAGRSGSNPSGLAAAGGGGGGGGKEHDMN